MINRNLIRVRVLQVVYAWYQNDGRELSSAERELMRGLEKSYDLYFYLLQLLAELTNQYKKRIETKRHKFLPSEEDLNPKLQLLNNKFILQLKDNKELNKHIRERGFNWNEHDRFLKSLLIKILDSDFYRDYVQIENPTYEDDKNFWHKAFKKFIYLNEELYDLLEDECIFWNDDISIVETFVLKTIAQFDETAGSEQSLLPMFKDPDDKEFARSLLDYSILDGDKNRELIKRHADKWELDRIAYMDVIIMQIALAEIINFDSIPIIVSLNEYIELAKYYSTPKSGMFVNGILDSIVKELQATGAILRTI